MKTKWNPKSVNTKTKQATHKSKKALAITPAPAFFYQPEKPVPVPVFMEKTSPQQVQKVSHLRMGIRVLISETEDLLAVLA